MNKTGMLRRGGALVCLLPLLAGCASSRPIQTKTVEVAVPVHVAVPANLTAPVQDAPVPDPLTNDGLLGVAESEKCRKTLANCQLERIEALQPGGARRSATWCARYEKVCKVGVP